jgi:Cu-Zn family superoxide dismutase
MKKYNNILYIVIFIGIFIIISANIYFYYIYPNYIMKKQVIAVANIIDDKIKGTVQFYEIINGDKVIVHVLLSGLKKNSIHGFHIHEAGDLSDNCMGACAHFNPYNKNHGGRDSKERHVGDLGNIKTDNNGNVDFQFSDKLIKLRGTKSNIIGRSIVIHEDEDDEGKGDFPDSLTTGHSGKRMVCAVIGYSKKMFKK